LAFVILKDYSDELNQSNQESTEGNRSKMVSEDPVETFAEGAFTVWVTGGSKVPESSRSRNDELSNTNNESIEPKVSEERVKENVSSLIAPYDRWEHSIWFKSTNGNYMCGKIAPHQQPA